MLHASTLDASCLQSLVLVELLAQDGEFALERLDHRLVDAPVDVGLGSRSRATAIACSNFVASAFEVITRRRELARAPAGFLPDCVVLFARLLRDKRLSRRHEILVGALIPYVAMRFDLVPDFISVAGRLDDAGVVLRLIVRSNPDLVSELWAGPPTSVGLIIRVPGR